MRDQIEKTKWNMRGKGAYTVFVGNLGEGDHLEDLGVDGRIILELIFTKYYGGVH